MRRHWKGSGLTEEKERAFQEDWARRILTCPKRRCRRLHNCADPREGRCPGLTTIPFTEGEIAARVRMIYVILRNRYNEIEAGIRPTEEERRADDALDRKMKEEAFATVKRELAGIASKANETENGADRREHGGHRRRNRIVADPS